MISKDQAVTAIHLAMIFEGKVEIGENPAFNIFNEAATASGTYYAMVEISGIVDEIFDKIPNRDALGQDVFHTFVFDHFNFPEDGSTPTLKGTVDDVVAFFVDEFELDSASLSASI